MNSSSRARFVAPFALSALLVACSTPPRSLPGPVDYPRSPAPSGLSIGNSASSPRPTETVVSDLPPSPISEQTRTPERPSVTPANAGDEVSMAIEQTPLPMFIQILFGSVLKVPYSMDQTINARTDIVTFKTSQPISRAKMQEVAVNLLRSYQLAVLDLGGVIRIVPESAQAGAAPPILRRGKTLPDTPESLRQVFHHVEVDVVKASDISQWLRQILGTRVNVVDDAARNGFLLSGTQADLRLALDLIRTLDQPRMRGRVAKRITPAFMNPNELSARLNDVLTAQGYGVAVGQLTSVPVLIIPVNAIGSIIVFTTTEEVMDQVIRWARELDRPLSAQTQNGIYTYAVKYADAQELAKTLGEILTGNVGSSAVAQPAAAAGQGPGGAVSAAAPARASGSNSRVVVNSPTNTLISRGTSPEEYQQIMALMRELDRPVKSAMIEVVVAELRLGGSKALGIEWNINPQTSSRGTIVGGTLGRLGVGSGGLTLGFANSAGQVVGILNTLASNNQARILSNPKVMARNGETASIQVGQEVPVVSSQQSSGLGGGLFGSTSGILQTIQYRSTGVILKVRPVINSGNRLDLEVSQEVSSAAETRTGVTASPTISTRRIDTKLSLRDGSTVLLGGLISRNESDANTGIPYLKDIPGLGALFRSQSEGNDQTELLIMITPYVISDDFESEAITDAILKTFGDWAQDIRPARVLPLPGTTAPPLRTPMAPAAVDSAPRPGTVAAPPMGKADSPVQGQSPLLPNPVAPRQDSAAPMPGNAPPPTPLTVAPSSPAAAAAAAAAAADTEPKMKVDQGVTVSRPQAAPAMAPAAESPPKPATGAPSTPTPSATNPNAGKQPAQTGKPVNDPQVKREIEELLKKQLPR